MSSLVVWIDTHQAKLFHLTSNGVQIEFLEDSGPTHLKETWGRNHRWDETDERRFFQGVAEHLKHHPAQEWLLVGPGIGRLHFEKYLKRHCPLLAQKIMGCEVSEGIDDKALVERGQSFFRHRQIYQGII